MRDEQRWCGDLGRVVAVVVQGRGRLEEQHVLRKGLFEALGKLAGDGGLARLEVLGVEKLHRQGGWPRVVGALLNGELGLQGRFGQTASEAKLDLGPMLFEVGEEAREERSDLLVVRRSSGHE